LILFYFFIKRINSQIIDFLFYLIKMFQETLEFKLSERNSSRRESDLRFRRSELGIRESSKNDEDYYGTEGT
jgi:hypothetical protein